MIVHSIEDQLILHEGLRLDVYKCPADKWTVGVGRNLEDVGLYPSEQVAILGQSNLSQDVVIEALKVRGITQDEAIKMLNRDVGTAENDLHTFWWYRHLDPVRQKVLIDMRFNLGPNRFREFKKMIGYLEVGAYFDAAEEMQDSLWYTQVGNRSKRLVKMMATGEDYTN